MNRLVHQKVLEEIKNYLVKENNDIEPYIDFFEETCNFYIPSVVKSIEKKYTRDDFDEEHVVYDYEGTIKKINTYLNNIFEFGNIPLYYENKILFAYEGLEFLVRSDFDEYMEELKNYYRKFIHVSKVNGYVLVFVRMNIKTSTPFDSCSSDESYYDVMICDEDGNRYQLNKNLKIPNKHKEDFIEACHKVFQKKDVRKDLDLVFKISESQKSVLNINPFDTVLLNFINPLMFDLNFDLNKKMIERLNQILIYDNMHCGLTENKMPYLKKLNNNSVEVLECNEVRKHKIIDISLDEIRFMFTDRENIFEQLNKRIQEALNAYQNHLHLSCLVMLGSVVEGICYTAVDLLKKNGVKFKYYPKVNDKEDVEMHRLSQYELIKILVEQGLFDSQLLDSMKVIKNFRNLIHPYHMDFVWPKVHLCDITWNMLNLIVDKIKEHKGALGSKREVQKN